MQTLSRLSEHCTSLVLPLSPLSQNHEVLERAGAAGAVGREGQSLNWNGAVAYCRGLTLAEHSDWGLPKTEFDAPPGQ
jgi:hypothetical protein